MQFKFFFALVLLGACITQVTFARTIDNEINKGALDDLIEKAKEAIEKLKKIVQEKLDEALNIIGNIKEQISEQVKNAISSLKLKLEGVIANAKNAIEEIKKKAEELGIDISDCLKDNEDRFQDVFNYLIQDEIECVQNEITSGLQIINEVIQIVTESYQAIEDLPQKLKECVSSGNPISCVKNLIEETIKLEKDLPAKIAQKVQEVQSFIAGLKGRLEACAAKQLLNAGIAVGKIVADVGKCAVEKENEQKLKLY